MAAVRFVHTGCSTRERESSTKRRRFSPRRSASACFGVHVRTPPVPPTAAPPDGAPPAPPSRSLPVPPVATEPPDSAAAASPPIPPHAAVEKPVLTSLHGAPWFSSTGNVPNE